MRTQTCSLLVGTCTQALRASTPKIPLRVSPSAYALSGSGLNNRAITTVSKSTSPASLTQLSINTDNEGYIYESSYDKTPIAKMPAASLVFEETHKWENKVAMECGLTGRNYTYAELRDATWRWGGLVQKTLGTGTTDFQPTVAILSPNSPEYPIVFFGTLAAGGIITTINAAYTPVEIAHHLSDSGANMLVVDSMMESLADDAIKILKKDIPVIVNGSSSGNKPNLQDLIKDTAIPFATDIEYNPDQVALLPYSSGTTGKPKGVRITHKAIAAGLATYHFPEALNVQKAEGNHQEQLLGLLPFFHIYGMSAILSSGLNRGTKIVTLPKFDPKTYADALKQHDFTVLHTVPPLLKFIVGSPTVTAKELTKVHTVVCGAAPVPLVAAVAMKEKAGDHLCFQEAFGMTETLCTHITPRNGEKLGCCGKLVPHASAKLIHLETGVSVPPGEKGELCVKGPSMMAGYHNRPDATKETIDEDGWLHTGDVAVCDEDGYFSIVDRIKELIKVKGLQVSPSELEDIILGHPGVADVGVIGVKHERAGEVPRAYIVPSKKNLTEKDIHSFLEDKIARHKKLVGGVRFVQDLPKNPTGKLLRRQLKTIAEEECLQG